MKGLGWRTRLKGLGRESGQVTVALVGVIFVLALFGAAVVAFGGALSGKSRMQRAADLAAISAARSLRDDLPRRLSPATVNGVPNPAHLTRSRYLARARLAALRGAQANRAGIWRVSVRFPERLSPAPLTAEVRLRGEWRGGGAGSRVEVVARAAAVVPLAGLAGGDVAGLAPKIASGGGYSGPLAIRQGRGMRPDVAAAFDRMAAAAALAGHQLLVSSAFRSDAEQAALFAANPDPKWVAPPGTSLHRCATELDLGPASAYGWLAANAGRFGFRNRYAWEPWHFGLVSGPEPCSPLAESGLDLRARPGRAGAGGGGQGQRAAGDGLLPGALALPAFVPTEYTGLIARAAARWNVPAALLAAQLQAESNFNPRAISSAGAQGIAQFMPGTAAAYNLTDPFDPAQAIMAQAHLMADLLRQFGGSAELALAAYNAGPGAVAPCNCIPDFPETIAYVQRITALLAGSGTALTLAPPLEVKLTY